MSKISITGIPARNSAIKGEEFVAKIVRESMGLYGLNLGSDKADKISNDGDFIAEQLFPTIENEFERWGAKQVNKNVKKINNEVGDFSSTAWALHETIIKEALRYLPTEKTIKAKKTYSEVKQMIDESKDKVIVQLKEMATPISSKEELIKAALVSVEDEKIAEMLGSMQWELGPEGRIIAEEVNAKESSIEKVDGIVLDNGFVSSSWITNPEKNTLELSVPTPILLTNYVIGEPELKTLRESIFKTLAIQGKKACILMARAFTPEAIKDVTEGKNEFAVILINAPYTDQREVMKDIEAVVGGRYIDTEEATLADIYITDIGCAKSIIARQFKAVISGIEDEQYKTRVLKRAEFLKGKVEGSESDFEKRAIAERIAQLTKGFALLKVGSLSEADRARLKDKCDDGVNTVRNALREGTVRGAGIALKEISDKMEEGDILKRPLRCIYDQIISSAPEGWEAAEWVRDAYWSLKVVLERTCAFIPTFVSINAIVTEANPEKCHCNIKQNE